MDKIISTSLSSMPMGQVLTRTLNILMTLLKKLAMRLSRFDPDNIMFSYAPFLKC